MEWVLLFALSVLVAIGVNAVQPKVMASTNPTAVKLQTSYAGKTFLTAAVFFVVIIVAAYVMDAVGERPSLP